ncbi:MAG: GMC family oxidoreductase [Myxococcota bacterium]
MSELEAGVIEGQTLEKDARLSADVCIIGSGAGGAVAAEVLSAAGLKVLVLEEGGYFTRERFRMREDECYPHLYQESAQRTSKDLSVSIFQGRAVGGTTVVNWTTCFRTPESTVDRWRSHHAVAHVDLDSLVPWFERAEARLNIKQTALEQSNANNRLLWDGCKALNLEVDTLYRNTNGCVQSGYCGMGCPVDGKQSMLVTYLPDAIKNGATVLSRCRVDRLRYSGEQVTGAECTLLDAAGLAPTGVKAMVTAKRFILSAGAIGSPALLLRSGTPDPHGRIGRRTFLHPVIVSAAHYHEPIHGYHGAPQSVASHHFAHRGEEVGYFLEAAPIYPLLMATALPGFGPRHRELMQKLPNISAHIALAIDGHHEGEEGGTVSLLNSGRPQLDYVVSPKTWAAFREAQKSMAQIQLAASQKPVEILTLHTEPLVIRSERDIPRIDDMPYAPCRVGVFSAHQMGGCGLSDDPKLGVARSSDGKVHGVANLHVIDGSLFPTSCGVNPQLSIYGMAGLLSSRLAGAWV